MYEKTNCLGTSHLSLGTNRLSTKQTGKPRETSMGKNKINNIIIMKTMKEDLPLKDVFPKKTLTNHSVRKTVGKKLKSYGIPKCKISNITNYNSEQG